MSGPRPSAALPSSELEPNRYPVDREATTIRERLVDEEAELALLIGRVNHARDAFTSTDAEFQKIEKQYLILQGTREDAKRYWEQVGERRNAQEALVARQRGYFHPVRKTPAEVLGMIFEMCCPISSPEVDERPAGDLPKIEDQAAPFRLAAVCRRWRETCLHHPAIWTVLDLDFDTLKRSKQARSSAAYIQTLLARSGSMRITIRVVKSQAVTYGTGDKTQPVINDLSLGLPRCQSLSLSVTTSDHAGVGYEPITALLRRATPELKSLYINGLCFPASIRRTRHLLQHAPLLETIVAQTCSNLTAQLAPQHQLKYFEHHDTITSARRDEIYEIATTCPNIAQLLASYLDNETEFGYATRPRLTLDNLRDLVIRTGKLNISSNRGKTFARNFCFPALESLNLRGSTHSTQFRIDFLEIHAATSVLLSGLTISLDNHLMLRFIQVLSQFRQLVYLQLRRNRFTSQAVDLFFRGFRSRGPDNTWLCPKLEYLSTSECSFSASCDPSVIFDALRLRLDASTLGVDNRPVAMVSVTLGMEMWNAMKELIRDAHALDSVSSSLKDILHPDAYEESQV